MKNKTSDASENCTSMCIQVVNKGKVKSRWSGENIHLLYIEMDSEKIYLV